MLMLLYVLLKMECVIFGKSENYLKCLTFMYHHNSKSEENRCLCLHWKYAWDY